METSKEGVIFIIFRYKEKEYRCPYETHWDETWNEWFNPFQSGMYEGVRTCGHDYSSLIRETYSDFPEIDSCENPIEYIGVDYIKKGQP